MELKSYWRFHNTSRSLYTRTLNSLVFFTINNNIFYILFESFPAVLLSFVHALTHLQD